MTQAASEHLLMLADISRSVGSYFGPGESHSGRCGVLMMFPLLFTILA
jgi:hypothetical protein